MNLLYDTNILIQINRLKNREEFLLFLNPKEVAIYISVVNEAEIKSFAFQNNWSTQKLNYLEDFLETVNIIDVNQNLINTYIEIDSYSQLKNPTTPKDYTFKSPRNMGKNDLWIASTTALLGLELVTTDKDFSHLENFTKIRYLSTDELKRFY